MTDRYLVLFDADHIREYVFASGRLREIRGASENVRQLTDQAKLMDTWGSWSDTQNTGVIYAGGGGGAIIVRTERHARHVCKEIERYFRVGTGSATLSAVYVAIPGELPGDEASAQEEAARALARRKASRARAELMPGGAVRFCTSDRIQPASGMVHSPEGDTLLVSHATATRRSINGIYRSNFLASEVWGLIRRSLPEDDIYAWEQAISPHQDIGSIGVQSKPQGYVALVYADGDRIGKSMREVVRDHGFAGYQIFSRAITDSANMATADALVASYGARPPENSEQAGGLGKPSRRAGLPFEVITVGGDDILLLCTADQGLAVACHLADAFQHHLTNNLATYGLQLSEPPSASVGVIIAHDSMPILVLERAGRELLRSAKDVPGGGIDFHIATASSIDRIGRVRSEEYKTDTHMLTMRPYTLANAKILLHHAQRMRGQDDLPQMSGRLSGSAVAALYEACRGDMVMVALNVLALQSRLSPSASNLITEALKALESYDHYPFTSVSTSRPKTALLDLLEAGEFAGQPWERNL